jgi:hypothetical protein
MTTQNVDIFPKKKDIIKIMNTLIAVHKEILDRSLASSSIVRPTKIGTVPIGFKTENKAANKYIKVPCFFWRN